MRKKFESNVQTGTVRKVTKAVSKSSQGTKMVSLPKPSGKVLKTIMSSIMKVSAGDKPVSKIVSRVPAKVSPVVRRKPTAGKTNRTRKGAV